jgi:hypothetical protein
MHFHLPKPLHGWREFVGEVGIIVFGVLIALGAEQVVEAIHWRTETNEARAALNSEAAANLGAALYRQQQQPCVESRLVEIGAILRAHAAGAPLALAGSIGRPVYYGAERDSWEVGVSSQALAHMNVHERLRFGSVFDNYANMDDVQKEEQQAWRKLDMLDDPSILAEGDWPLIHQAYADANSLAARIKLITGFVLAQKNLGLKPSQIENVANVSDAMRHFCSPILAKVSTPPPM